MKIVFALPSRDIGPIGGYKIVYEYANRLAERGHEVTIAYCSEHDMSRTKLPLGIRTLMSCVLMKINPRWLRLIQKVVKVAVPSAPSKGRNV